MDEEVTICNWEGYGSEDEYPETRAIHYNPFRHMRFDSEETRDLVKQYGIRDMCKHFFPPETDEHEHLIPLAQEAMEEVIEASKYIRLTSLNPAKLFAFCFVQKSQLSSKQGLELLGLPLTKSGKQFSILSKGRQLYQQFRFCQHNSFEGAPWSRPAAQSIDGADQAKTLQTPEPEQDKDLIKKELFALHAEQGVFGSCTLDVINKTADMLVQHEPGVLKCQKKYKLLIQKIQSLPGLKGSRAKRYADQFVIVLRNR